MTISNELVIALESLIAELNKSGKSENASFFIEKLAQLKDMDISHESKISIMEELLRCRAMAQYANFSYYEESLLGDLIKIINSQLKTL